MGLRLVGNSALWDPIVFLKWLSTHKLKNKPKDRRDPSLVYFVQRNSSEKDEYYYETIPTQVRSRLL